MKGPAAARRYETLYSNLQERPFLFFKRFVRPAQESEAVSGQPLPVGVMRPHKCSALLFPIIDLWDKCIL